VDPSGEPAPPPPRALADAEIAARVARGRGVDVEAEGELCRRFALPVRLYGICHLRDAAAAADLVQDVLVTVLERLRAGALREPERLASFVLGTCRLAVQDRRRGASRREAILARFAGDLARQEEDRPRLDLQRLDGCLAGLPVRERAIVVMTFYAGQPALEIAAELGTTPGNVRVLRHRALVRLRACMGPEEVAP
jgi:RNA polymerase sigma-70 factor (ECF subfamily)